MNRVVAILGVMALTAAVSACATTAAPPTAEQRAACEKMMGSMGEGATHSHGADKGGGVNAMGMTHAQCRRMIK